MKIFTKIRKWLMGLLLCAALCGYAPMTVQGGVSGTELSLSSQKTVVFHKADGSIKIRKTDSKGRLTIPANKNPKGGTFLGWSDRPGQSQDPKYQAGQVIQVKKCITHLYAVVYNWEQEPDVRVDKLAENLSRYSRVIFVGDSRTYFLKKTLFTEYGKSVFSKASFVCKPGEGLSWFQEIGESMLRQEIAATQAGKDTRPIAIIFNLGANDLSTRNCVGAVDPKSVSERYISYMNKLGKKLSAKNCRLFYMSVNPVNAAMKPIRKEADLRYFNDVLKKNLSTQFQWIDTYKYLMKYGYSTYNAFKENIDDGVHYSMRTSKRIYKYCMYVLGKY